jgi:hypothetical protein
MKETLKEVAERILFDNTGMLVENHPSIKQSMLDLAKWQQEQLCNSEIIQRIRATKSDAEARRIIKSI